MDADWDAFCQAIYKGIEGSEWEELYHHDRDLSKAAEAQKPIESQKAKALWVMKAAKDRGMNSTTWLGKTTSWEGIRRDWSCGKNISKTPSPRWTKL